MKLALIKPPATYANWYKRPILGLTYLQSYLQQHGVECRIFDAYFHDYSTSELLEMVTEYKPDIIGLTAMTHEIHQAADIATQLKKLLPATPAIIGGCHITAMPKRTLSEFEVFDYGICGEGEVSSLELLQCLENGDNSPSNIETIPGLVFRNGLNIQVSTPRNWLNGKDLDQMPHPCFKDYYGDNQAALTSKKDYYVMFTSRGCPYNCAFCMQVLGRKVRRRSATSICDEIEYAIAKYGAHTIDFADEIFLFDGPKTRETLNMMIQRGLHKQIKWTGLTRANVVTRDIIELARESGCIKLEMGVESGDNEILKRIGKNITTDQIRDAIAIIKDAGIQTGAYFILGHPGETEETLQKTVEFSTELNTDTIAVGIMVPYPGTQIYTMAENNEYGYSLTSQNWRDYDKYGGRALEFNNLSYDLLEKYQKKALANLYIKNMRLGDMAKYAWRVRKALYFFVKKKIKDLPETDKDNKNTIYEIPDSRPELEKVSTG